MELAERLYSGENVQGSWNFGPNETSHKTVRDVVEYMKIELPELNYDISREKFDHEAGLLLFRYNKVTQRFRLDSKSGVLKSV